MNKKAIFFTILAITLLALFLISYSIYNVSVNSSVNKRVRTMNNFVYSVEEDLQRKLYIFGFRSIYLFEKNVTEMGKYLKDNPNYDADEGIQGLFENLFYRGEMYFYEDTPNPPDYEDMNLIIRGVTFNKIVESIDDKAEGINVDVEITGETIQISQDDPWNIQIIFDATLLIKDKGGLAQWTRPYHQITKIPIENFEDPVYIVETRGLAGRKITKTPHETFVSWNEVTGWDVTKLEDHLKKYYYKESIAPSFLSRLIGDLDAGDVYGIESFVDLDELGTQGLPVDSTKSVVDYIYFQGIDTQECTITGMPSWFKIDNDHRDDYNIPDQIATC